MERITGVALEVFTEAVNECVEGPGRSVKGVAPDPFEQLAAGQDTAFVFGEETDQHHLALGERDRALRCAGPHGVHIDLALADLHHRPGSGRCP